jgi:hypothetical protein
MIDTWYGKAFESIAELLLSADDFHVGMKAPSGQTVPGFGTPKPSPFGPHYALHPELSRPGWLYLASQLAIPAAYVGTPIVLFELNRLAIEEKPEEEQRGFWQMFSSALTGTVGGDYAGLV